MSSQKVIKLFFSIAYCVFFQGMIELVQPTISQFCVQVKLWVIDFVDFQFIGLSDRQYKAKPEDVVE